ncbi:MAG: DUF2163 domain-containing protein [Alphaproteobacteria bacterium]|nr:DUF2163 domain-containing protein [Alphaproteobacteria bacterium]
MKQFDGGLAGHLASGATTLAWCWRITRSDGEVFGFTDHDVTLVFDGTDFEPESGLIASEVRAGSDLAVDSQDAEGVVSSDRITETDILDGRWDNAIVEVWRVNWQSTAERVLLRRGNIGQVRRGRMIFVAEVRSMAHILQQTVGRAYMATCDAELGDGRCKVNLEASAFKGTGSVTSVLRDRAFVVSGIDAFDDGWFAFGSLEWASGENNDRRAEVMLHSKVGGIVTISLLEKPVRAIAIGDAFVVRAGCDKRTGTCRAKFANMANFRGFPHIPGQDALIRYATKSGRNSGEVL